MTDYSWEVRPLGSMLLRRPRYGINAPASRFDRGGIPYLRITDIDEDGHFRPSPRVKVRHPNAGAYMLEQGDLVFARTGATVGKAYRYDPADGQLVFAGFLINVTPDPRLLNPGYLATYIQSASYWNWVATTSVRSGRPGINGREYALLPLPVPPMQVQNSISEAMADCDAEIKAIESVIAKKQAIKQGMAQQLLTGQMPIHGCTGPWMETTLGELGLFLKGHGIKRDDLQGTGGVPCIRYGELYTHFGDYTSRPKSFVDKTVARTAAPVLTGDLLFAGSGETKREIGKCVAFIGEPPAVAGGDIVIFRGDRVDAVYLANVMNSPPIVEQKARFGQGDAVVHISSRALASIRLTIPSLNDQRAIAKVLIDVDTEIETLKRRLEKVKAIKQGMAQHLLTGKIRLPVEAAA